LSGAARLNSAKLSYYLGNVSRSARSQKRHLRIASAGEGDQPQEPTDHQLIDAFERGDLRTGEILYDRMERVVQATLCKVLGGRGADHDDLVQTAFEQILYTLAQKKFARACSLTSWAVSVTTHIALSTIRKRQQERRRLATDSELPERSSRPGPERHALFGALRSELGKLPPVTAEVVVLHEVMGYDLAEIAVLTGLSVAAAQSRLVRGKAELRRRLDSQFPKGRA